jgi:hypothetical protein
MSDFETAEDALKPTGFKAFRNSLDLGRCAGLNPCALVEFLCFNSIF